MAQVVQLLICALTSTSSSGLVKGIRKDGAVLVARNLTSTCGACIQRYKHHSRSVP